MIGILKRMGLCVAWILFIVTLSMGGVVQILLTIGTIAALPVSWLVTGTFIRPRAMLVHIDKPLNVYCEWAKGILYPQGETPWVWTCF